MDVDNLIRAGRETPYLAFDLKDVDYSLARFRQAFPEVSVHYAVKCNPWRPLLEHIHLRGCGFEVASCQEIELLKKIGVNPAQLIFSNPVRARTEIAMAHAAGVWRFAVDSISELRKLAEVAPGAAVYARLSTVSAASTVPSEGKFGIDKDTAFHLLKEAEPYGLKPYGITFHVGSQMEDPTAWMAAIKDAVEVIERLRRSGIRLMMLDIGGGFPVAYSSEMASSLEDVGATVADSLKGLPYPMHIIAEPGRSLVASAGVFVCEVIQVAQRGSTWWAHTNLGVFNGMMEVLETDGALQYRITESRPPVARRPYHVTGPTCDSQDTFAFNVELSTDLREGDRLFVHTAGAYTTAYASTFNGYPIPQVLDVEAHSSLTP
ncbi:type III PLP-dependent enzyme [[Actinomadura] parvosata]|uniref:type III PLP-dependent enzyme n=1 Tax=[Actinomadura] parvosata TaxID=1955412 RepID=UPI00406D2E7D